MKVVLAVLVLVAAVSARHSRYDNYEVYRLTPTTDKQLETLRELENYADFDFWRGPSTKNVNVDIMVPPHKFAQFSELVNDLQISSEKYVDNVQKLVDNSQQKTAKNVRALDWNNYYDGPTIEAWLESLAEQYDVVTLLNIGKSYEGRNLAGVKVSYGSGKKAVFIEAGIHAREWISPATVTYILNELLTSNNADVRDIAESYDWYFFPSVNPDGYAYTHSSERLWRKTRQPHGACRGCDPNRNWGYHWMDGGASNNPCSETYAGPSAFSEPETKQLSDYISTIQQDLIGYIGFHSYSQLLLIPYGHSSAHVENYDELEEIGLKAARSLAQRYGTRYTVGNIVEVIYVASGGSMDWVKGTHQTPITYTYELRDTGRWGFLLPPEQIIPTAEETLDSLVTIIQEAKARGY